MLRPAEPSAHPSPVPPTSEARHTPGPWLPHFEHREGSDQYSFRITDVCESEVVCAKTAWSDTAPTKGDRDRIRANFALIASAPALLAAAEAALPLLLLAAIKAPDRECAKRYSETCGVLTAAIKAAKGGVA